MFKVQGRREGLFQSYGSIVLIALNDVAFVLTRNLSIRFNLDECRFERIHVFDGEFVFPSGNLGGDVSL